MKMLKELKFNNKIIKFRQWKVKDKKLLDTSKTKYDRRKVYVYNCLENPETPLDIEEFNYVLVNIRDFSLNKPIEYVLNCPYCGDKVVKSLNISEVVSCSDADYSPIVVGDLVIELQDVQSQKLYEENAILAKTLSERYLADFALHVKSINGNDLTYEQVISQLENLDVGTYEQIFTQWDSKRFKCNFTSDIQCDKCKEITTYSFEDVKDFYPNSWNI